MDLFAGVGTMGIEACNQGAAEVSFVEHNPQVLRVLKRNISAIGAGYRVKLYAEDVRHFLPRQKTGFDLVFLDPPYNTSLAAETLELLGSKAALNPGAWVLAEHHHKAQLQTKYGSLELTKVYKYGETRISLYTLAT